MKHMSAVKKQEVESDLISTKPNFLFSFLKKGRLDKAADAFNTYVVLKVHNLKSTTIDRRGSEPSWEQDFMFEISADEKGFTIELWKKGLLWDSILGILWIPLAAVEHATDEGPGAWWTLHSEIIKNGSEIQGTRTPTSHEILLDVYFVLPFDVHEDLDYRRYYRGMLLQGKTHSHKDTHDRLSPIESGLSMQENKLRRNKNQTGRNFAKARWARAIQKTTTRYLPITEKLECCSFSYLFSDTTNMNCYCTGKYIGDLLATVWTAKCHLKVLKFQKEYMGCMRLMLAYGIKRLS
ncbi:protein unc-13 homolog A isoform X3 [Anas platyrhynchos]|uniref:protein unc-13 homolog A isoform X3 n=1 Tax=Anas platyrhynchos TaxID=8839 RepID=UPI003AF2D0CC